MKITFKGQMSEIEALVKAVEGASRVVIKSVSFDGRNTLVMEVEEEQIPTQQPDDFDHLWDDFDMTDYSDFDAWNGEGE